MGNAIDWSRMSAIVVAEDKGFRSIVQNTLRRIGLRDVEAAKTGSDAFNLLMSNSYSLIVVHREMKPSGAKFVEVLRKNGTKIIGAAQVPVVIVANEGATPEMIFEAADCGANYLAQLPISAQSLMKAAQIAISQPQAFAERANAARARLA